MAPAVPSHTILLLVLLNVVAFGAGRCLEDLSPAVEPSCASDSTSLTAPPSLQVVPTADGAEDPPPEPTSEPTLTPELTSQTTQAPTPGPTPELTPSPRQAPTH